MRNEGRRQRLTSARGRRDGVPGAPAELWPVQEPVWRLTDSQRRPRGHLASKDGCYSSASLGTDPMQTAPSVHFQAPPTLSPMQIAVVRHVQEEIGLASRARRDRCATAGLHGGGLDHGILGGTRARAGSLKTESCTHSPQSLCPWTRARSAARTSAPG